MGCSPCSLFLLVLIVISTSGCIAYSAPPAITMAPTPVVTPAATQALSQLTTIPVGFPYEYDGIKFEGDVDVNCSLQTVHALDLLDTKAHEDFLLVTNYIGIIECRDAWSAMYPFENPPRFRVGKATRDSGAMWYAGAIAHDSCHSRQYHDYLKIHPGTAVPVEIYTGETSEKECIRYQFGVLEKMGAPKKMLDYVANSSSQRYWESKNVWW